MRVSAIMQTDLVTTAPDAAVVDVARLLTERRVGACLVMERGELAGIFTERDLGILKRSDLTGFNWANVPAILTEVGFLTNPSEDRALATHRTVKRIARGLEGGVLAYLRARGLR